MWKPLLEPSSPLCLTYRRKGCLRNFFHFYGITSVFWEVWSKQRCQLLALCLENRLLFIFLGELKYSHWFIFQKKISQNISFKRRSFKIILTYLIVRPKNPLNLHLFVCLSIFPHTHFWDCVSLCSSGQPGPGWPQTPGDPPACACGEQRS